MAMNTPLAWKNLIHNRVRTLVALAGVGFAVILIFMQIGFKGGIRKTATQIFDAMEFDLMLRSPSYLFLTDPRTFPRERVYQAASLPEVISAQPFYLGLTEWQRPQPSNRPAAGWEGEWRGIIAMATNPLDPAFRIPEIREKARLLTDPRFVLLDRKSKPEYGPQNGKEFGPADIGVKTSLGKGRFEIVGTFELGTGLASNGACLTNIQGFSESCYWQPAEVTNFGLIKLAAGTDLVAAQERLQALLGALQLEGPISAAPADVEVLTRAEVNAREEYRWVEETPIGKIFNLMVWVALLVGVAIVYQVLSTDIANMLSEYATLKAMGYSNRYLTSVVMAQSVLLAVVGYFPSLVVSWVLYKVIEHRSGMPMEMTGEIAIVVALLTLIMCMLSGLAALRKLFQADPADLF
jgi:putative ABC transport system permease protein